MGIVENYLIIINIIAFSLSVVEFLLYKKKSSKKEKIQVILNVSILLGGAVGATLAFFIWNRKGKQLFTQMAYTGAMFVIQLLLYLLCYRPNKVLIEKWFVTFYPRYKFFLLYVLIMCIISFILFAVDKKKAINGQWRIQEKVLLGTSFLGGAAGGLLAMHLFHHKTQKPYFSIGIPAMLVLQVIGFFAITIILL